MSSYDCKYKFSNRNTKTGLNFEKFSSNFNRFYKDKKYKLIYDDKSKLIYLKKDFKNGFIIFIEQNNLKKYLKLKYNIDIFRNPDEAFLIEFKDSNRKILNIIKKKEQTVEGSVETKLWASPSLKKEYEIMTKSMFEINYSLCLSKYFYNKFIDINNQKYSILFKILKESNISVLFCIDSLTIEKYNTDLDNWLNNSLL